MFRCTRVPNFKTEMLLFLFSTFIAISVGYIQLKETNDTSATISWNYNWENNLWGPPNVFEIELSEGPASEDFTYLDTVTVSDLEAQKSISAFNLHSFVGKYTIGSQLPKHTFRVRVIPIFRKGRGNASAPVTITTLIPSANYWEPLQPRRFAMASSGRGFSDPVTQRPHLDPNVEIFTEGVSSNPLRFSDPTTDSKPVFPSGRRGHSLSLLHGTVYLFGGRTDGEDT